MPKVSQEYRRLYHYTTWNGLLGILESKSFWATHHRFLNDSLEGALFRGKFCDLIQPAIRDQYEKFLSGRADRARILSDIEKNGGWQHVTRHDAEAFVSAMYRASAKNADGPYILSFCGEDTDPYINENGLLSQWRGYGRDGGFALEIDTEKFETLLTKEHQGFDYVHFELGDVVYSDDDSKFQHEFASRLKDIVPYAAAMIETALSARSEEPPSGETAARAYSAFAGCGARYKHRGFKEEREIRLVAELSIQNEQLKQLARDSNVTLKPDKPRKFRDRDGERAPFIAILESLGADIPVVGIVVGPHKEKEARAAALRVMLRNSETNVRISDIPYIG